MYTLVQKAIKGGGMVPTKQSKKGHHFDTNLVEESNPARQNKPHIYSWLHQL
jgi:hypothetical protein